MQSINEMNQSWWFDFLGKFNSAFRCIVTAKTILQLF